MQLSVFDASISRGILRSYGNVTELLLSLNEDVSYSDFCHFGSELMCLSVLRIEIYEIR